MYIQTNRTTNYYLNLFYGDDSHIQLDGDTLWIDDDNDGLACFAVISVFYTLQLSINIIEK